MDGCVTLTDGDKSFNGEIEYVPMKWFETPSVVPLSPGITNVYPNKPLLLIGTFSKH